MKSREEMKKSEYKKGRPFKILGSCQITGIFLRRINGSPGLNVWFLCQMVPHLFLQPATIPISAFDSPIRFHTHRLGMAWGRRYLGTLLCNFTKSHYFIYICIIISMYQNSCFQVVTSNKKGPAITISILK